MATRRSRKQSVRKRAKTQQNTENRMMDSKIRKEVALIFICLFSFLLFFSNLGFCGFVGEILQHIQFVLFGSFSFLFPFLLLFILFFYMSSQDKDNASRRIVAMIACYLLTESFFSGKGNSYGLVSSCSGRRCYRKCRFVFSFPFTWKTGGLICSFLFDCSLFGFYYGEADYEPFCILFRTYG